VPLIKQVIEDFFKLVARDFSYKANLGFRLGYMLFLTAFGIVLGIVAANRGSVMGGIIFSGIWGVFFLLITLVAVIGSSSIRIAEDCIASVIFGHVWKSISWSDVKNIRILSIAEFPSGKRIKNYYVEPSPALGFLFSKIAAVSFKETIQGQDALREAINVKIKEYGIRVILPGSEEITPSEI
jgi:hypothetical protein